MPASHQKTGFSLVEILVVLAIIALLTAIVLPNWTSMRQQSLLKTTTTNIVSDLDSLRSRAASGVNGEPHGLYVPDATAYVTFAGPVYQASDSENVIHTLSDGTSISLATSEGDNEFVFSRLTGFVGETATVTVSITGHADVYQEIVVQPDGTIYRQ